MWSAESIVAPPREKDAFVDLRRAQEAGQLGNVRSSMPLRDVVTGAFSYTGHHVTQCLLANGRTVGTLTNHSMRPHRLAGAVDVHPLRFEDPDSLTRALEGADTLYNTYWIRFAHGDVTFERAVENTEVLVMAAVRAGVRRVVHVSIANVEDGLGLPYFDGKAACEQIVKASGCSYAIIRPTVLFGGTDIFISNIAWLLHRFPIFGVAGDGRYGIQPVHVEDHARLMVEAGGRNADEIFDSAGPEAFTFEELVREIARAIDRPARVVHVPPAALVAAARLIGSSSETSFSIARSWTDSCAVLCAPKRMREARSISPTGSHRRPGSSGAAMPTRSAGTTPGVALVLQRDQ